MKMIWLTKGQFTLVDDEDYEMLSKQKWYAGKSKNTYYARARPKKYGPLIHMHRIILGITDPELFPDHMDKNGLNNQRYNLRIATRSQNNTNRVPIGVSKYLGVFPAASTKNPWFARINKDKKRKYLGIFPNEIAAAIAYNKAAIELYGEFANLNNIETATHLHSAAG